MWFVSAGFVVELVPWRKFGLVVEGISGFRMSCCVLFVGNERVCTFLL